MDILDDMGVSKLSAKVFSKENYSFNHHKIIFFLIVIICITRTSSFLKALLRPPGHNLEKC